MTIMDMDIDITYKPSIINESDLKLLFDFCHNEIQNYIDFDDPGVEYNEIIYYIENNEGKIEVHLDINYETNEEQEDEVFTI